MKTNNPGYSLYEFIIVISIISVIMSFTMPGIYSQLISHNLNSTFVQLDSAFRYAREEAVRRNSSNILICPLSVNVNGIISGDNCGGNDGAWSSGVITFIDADNSGTYVSGERIQALIFENDVVVTITNSGANLNLLRLNSSGQISNVSANSLLTVNIQQSRYGICRYSQYSLNIYGSFTQIAQNQSCN